jgi:hypothetical protein
MGVGTYAKFTVVSSNKMAFKPSEQLSGDMLKNDARFYSSFVFFTVVHSMHLNATRSFFLNSNPQITIKKCQPNHIVSSGCKIASSP